MTEIDSLVYITILCTTIIIIMMKGSIRIGFVIGLTALLFYNVIFTDIHININLIILSFLLVFIFVPIFFRFVVRVIIDKYTPKMISNKFQPTITKKGIYRSFLSSGKYELIMPEITAQNIERAVKEQNWQNLDEDEMLFIELHQGIGDNEEIICLSGNLACKKTGLSITYEKVGQDALVTKEAPKDIEEAIKILKLCINNEGWKEYFK